MTCLSVVYEKMETVFKADCCFFNISAKIDYQKIVVKFIPFPQCNVEEMTPFGPEFVRFSVGSPYIHTNIYPGKKRSKFNLVKFQKLVN